MRPLYGKIAALVIFGAYFLNAALKPHEWHLIDGVNLIFHEAGHFIFAVFPQQWIEIAGGSVMQVLVPLTVTVTLLLRRQAHAACLALLWTGQSLIDVSVYAADALKMQLPLIADGLIHDWNHLLWHFGALRHTETIARSIHLSGLVVIGLGLLGGLLLSFARRPETYRPAGTRDRGDTAEG